MSVNRESSEKVYSLMTNERARLSFARVRNSTASLRRSLTVSRNSVADASTIDSMLGNEDFSFDNDVLDSTVYRRAFARQQSKNQLRNSPAPAELGTSQHSREAPHQIIPRKKLNSEARKSITDDAKRLHIPIFKPISLDFNLDLATTEPDSPRGVQTPVHKSFVSQDNVDTPSSDTSEAEKTEASSKTSVAQEAKNRKESPDVFKVLTNEKLESISIEASPQESLLSTNLWFDLRSKLI